MYAVKVIVTIIVVLGAIIGAGYLGMILGKKKIDVDGLVDEAKKAMPVFDNVAAVVESLLPEPYKAMAVTVATAAQKAVSMAEGIALAGQLPEAQRKSYATNLINSALLMEKIQLTPDVNKAVSLAVDLSVGLFLPKTHAAPAVQAAATAPAQEVTTAAQ